MKTRRVDIKARREGSGAPSEAAAPSHERGAPRFDGVCIF